MRFIVLLPWLIWVIGYPIYKKIKHEEIWRSKIYIPVVWILCLVGNSINLYLYYKYKFTFMGEKEIKMGCHTWFYRPVTQEEFQLLKEYAPIDIEKYTGKSSGFYDKWLHDNLLKSLNENIPCVYGEYWWQLGYGCENPKLDFDFVTEIHGEKGLFAEVKRYHDTFRVYNYPRKVIHNRHELRRFMKKKYFELENWQLEKISEFFRENKGGIIIFG